MTDWRNLADCRGKADLMYHPSFDREGLDPNPEALEAARAVCGGCPVRRDCLKDAMANFEKFGVWGGLTYRERHSLRRKVLRHRGAA